MRIRALSLAFFFAASISLVCAQQTERYTQPDALYQEGLELYNKQQYVAAQRVFGEVVSTRTDPHSETRINAEYYIALCALELYHGDSEFLVDDFIESHPQSPRIFELTYTMGEHYFNRRKYRSSAEWLEKLSGHRFSEPKKSQYHFMLGYSYFMLDDFDLAKENLQQVKKDDSYTSAAATFYYGHILYKEEKFPLALKEFQKLQTNDDFGPFVPYYIAQILYEQGDYDELVKVGTALLERAEETRQAEINRFIGEGYYNQQKFEEALPYLVAYKELGGKMRDPDLYELGYVHYKTEQYQEAISYLNKIVDSEDSLAQNAYFILGDCYLQTDKKPEAMNAFSGAYMLNFDQVIVEETRFNYAKLSYEVGNPFADPGRELNKFLDDYPESEYFEEASTYLVDAYLNTKDYQRALESLERLELKTANLRKAYQKVAYLRGVQLFNARKYGQAKQLLLKSLDYPIDEDYTAWAVYWLGDCEYRTSNYDAAVKQWMEYLSKYAVLDLAESDRVNYSLGYAYFKQKDYAAAANRFKDYFDNKSNAEPIRKDALIRAGDCYFGTKGYFTAARYYNDAQKLEGADSDYALFQLSRCQGLQAKQDGRIESLKKLIADYPASDLLDDSWYELGNAQFDQGQNMEALKAYEEVIGGFPTSFYVKRSLLQCGLIHYNERENQKALNRFKAVVSQFPNTEEAVQAVDFVEKIYIEIDQVDDYAAWVKGVSFVDISTAQLDSLAWDAANEKYLSGNCERSIGGFENYLNSYPEGIFALDAHYYLAECAYSLDNFDLTLIHFVKVGEANQNKFTENAALKSAYIHFSRENWTAALESYKALLRIAQYPENKLTAKLGLMRASFKMDDYSNAIVYAEDVLNEVKASSTEKEEAHIILARSYWETQNSNEAYEEYLWLEKYGNGNYKAESMYHLAQIYYEKGHYEESQTKIFDLVKNMPSYKYWGNRGLVLLALNYWKLEDYYQAYYTLDQVIDRVSDEEVVEWAMKVRAEIEIEEQDRKAEELEREELQNRIDTIQGPDEIEEE